jgi:hypothetical protein
MEFKTSLLVQTPHHLGCRERIAAVRGDAVLAERAFLAAATVSSLAGC